MTLPRKGFDYILIAIITTLLTSCSVFQESSKNNISSGFFNKKDKGEKSYVYIQVKEDSLTIYKASKPSSVDNYSSSIVYLGENHNDLSRARFLTSSFDVDLLTIPVKYRFSTKNVQPQLNTEIGGVVYLGYRTDRYKLKHTENPLHKKSTRISHYGYSFGVFSGFGNTFMSPTTTFNRTEQEYDAIVWSNGIAAILGFNNLSVGVALGFDRLMDDNSNIWIYQNKPWIGFTIGLNLY